MADEPERVMRLLGLVDGTPSPFDGQFLVEFDPNRRGTDPYGRPMLALIVTSPHLDKAMRFASFADAHETWRRPSWRWPHDGRADRELNRPLTAFNVEILSLETAQTVGT